jgi:hypothetical protein
MGRPITLLAIFMISLSLFAQLMLSTGAAAAIGLDTRVGGQEATDKVQKQSEEVESGSPTGSTLFGMYNVLVSQIKNLLGILNPGLRMMYNVGVPPAIVGGPNTVGFLRPLFTVIKFVGVVSFLRGYDL